MYLNTREEEVAFLKRLWTGQDTRCPKCAIGILEHLHKKAKKSNCEWKCPNCGQIFRTIGMLKQLSER